MAKRLSCARVEAPVLSVGEAPGQCRGPLLMRQDPAYRLTWTLVPPAPGPLMRAPSPLETTLTQSESLPLWYEGAVAVRRASRLSCGVPESAVANPGSSKITHEPLSSSLRCSARDGLSVVTLISVPARMLVSPIRVTSLPLRLRMTGGG